MRILACVFFLLAACSKGSSNEQSASTKSPEPAVEPAAPAPKAAAVSARSPSDPNGGPCRDGWHATMRGWMGAGFDEATIECNHGKATLTRRTVGAHVEPDDPDIANETYALSRDLWNRVWGLLERARWRDLATDTCVEKGDDNPIDSDYMDTDIEISDGITTKKVTCGLKVGSYHLMVLEAFQQAHDMAEMERVGEL